MSGKGWNEITATVITISRRCAYLIEVKDGRFPVRVWLKPSFVVGLSDALENNLDVTDEGLACVNLAIEQGREARREEKRLA